ncbi:MAG: hypothetical protein V1744_03180 [Candidatus Altiarchaeota archaeon]
MAMNFNIVFKSFDARRLSNAKGHININNNSTISSVTKEEGKMNVGFIFSCNYEPNVGIVRIEGDLLVEDAADVVDNAVKEWEASERSNLPKDMAEKVHNAILSNCIVEASILARDLKLPVPMPLPHVTLNKPDAVSKTDTSYIR